MQSPPHSVAAIVMHTPALWGAFAFIILFNAWIFLYFRRLYNRLLKLKDSGIPANAVVSGSKPFRNRAGRFLAVEYEFNALTGESCRGRTSVHYSDQALKDYGAGKTIPIVYSQAPNVSQPTQNLPAALQNMARINRVTPFIFIANVLMICYIMFFHVTGYIRKH